MDNDITDFAKALGIGTLAGGGPLSMLILPMLVGGMSWSTLVFAIYLAALPLLIAGGVTLLGMVAIGLPFTAFLRQQRCEDVVLYSFAGASFGFIIPTLALAITDHFYFGSGAVLVIIPGILAGMSAGWSWGR